MGHDGRDGFPKGTADALWRNAPMIREFAPDALVVVSADAVYKLDYGAVVDEHAESGAAVTMVTTEVEPGDAGRYGVVQLDGERITDYVYKPDDPATNTISNEVFVFSPDEVLDRLDAIAEESGELEDLGDELLPELVDDGRARAHRVRRLLARRRDDRRLPLRAHGAARAPAADRPRRPRLAGAHARRLTPRDRPRAGGRARRPEHARDRRDGRRDRRALRDRPRRGGRGGRRGARLRRAPGRGRALGRDGRAGDRRRPRARRGGAYASARPTARSRWSGCGLRSSRTSRRAGASRRSTERLQGSRQLRLGREVVVRGAPRRFPLSSARQKSTVRKVGSRRSAQSFREWCVVDGTVTADGTLTPYPAAVDVSPAGLVPEVPLPLALEPALGA